MRTWWRVSFFLGGSLRRACPQPLPDFRRPPPSPFPSSRLPRGQGPATTVRPGCGGGMPPHCDTGHQHPQRFRHFNSGAGHGQTVLWGLTQGFAAAKGSANPTVSTKHPTELSPSPQVLLTKKAFSMSIFLIFPSSFYDDFNHHYHWDAFQNRKMFSSVFFQTGSSASVFGIVLYDKRGQHGLPDLIIPSPPGQINNR